MIRFLSSWRKFQPGENIEFQPGVEAILVKRGKAEFIPGPPEEPECAMVGPPETAMRPRAKARRRKASHG